MNDTADPTSLVHTYAELERRVLALEARVAALPTSEQIVERVTAQLPPPVAPPLPPSLKDIDLPPPSVQTMVDTAKTPWTLFEIFNELRMLFWTLVDRRYHMAWITRVT